MREVLLSVKVIKLNGWEEHHARRVAALRRQEVIYQRLRFTAGTAFNVVAELTPTLANALMYITYVKLMKKPLDPAAAFVSTSIFYALAGTSTGIDI